MRCTSNAQSGLWSARAARHPAEQRVDGGKGTEKPYHWQKYQVKLEAHRAGLVLRVRKHAALLGVEQLCRIIMLDPVRLFAEGARENLDGGGVGGAIAVAGGGGGDGCSSIVDAGGVGRLVVSLCVAVAVDTLLVCVAHLECRPRRTIADSLDGRLATTR
jgi:hypothetical protein